MSAKLIGENDVERIVGPGELLVLTFNTRISKREAVIDEEANAVGPYLGSIDIPLILLYG